MFQIELGKENEQEEEVWRYLGKAFNLSAVAVGKKLKEIGLRTPDGSPTDKALVEEYCKSTPMKDGTPFYLWNKDKVSELFKQTGLQGLSEQEIRCKELAERLVKAEKEIERGNDKVSRLMEDSVFDDMEKTDKPIINKFLKELGSTIEFE